MPTTDGSLLKSDFSWMLGKLKFLGSGGSMVASLKLKGIDGGAHKKWNLRLNLTQRGKTYQDRTQKGFTD